MNAPHKEQMKNIFITVFADLNSKRPASSRKVHCMLENMIRYPLLGAFLKNGIVMVSQIIP